MRTSSVLSPLNPGTPFDPSWIDLAPQTASFDPDGEIGSPTTHDLGLIASLLDLTSLNSDDTAAKLESLFQAALDPLGDGKRTVAGVCIYPAFLDSVGTWLSARGVRLVTVAGGFPHALGPLEARCNEIALCARCADEVDFPIPRFLALEGRWEDLYQEVRELVRAASGTPTKAILATGELHNQQTMYRAAITCMMAGASFVKTSTGKERVNATIYAGSILCRAIKDYSKRTGHKVGLKPAGGIRSAQEAMHWIALVRARLGEEWLTPGLFRIGASSLLDHLRYVSA